jgi:uncharacterized Zn-binding protein involved in type VI secretion
MVSGIIPHAGGPIIGRGCVNVLIEGMPASIAGDQLQCNGAVDTIVSGSATVFINGRPAARVGDRTAHEGIIVSGCTRVQIGD